MLNLLQNMQNRCDLLVSSSEVSHPAPSTWILSMKGNLCDWKHENWENGFVEMAQNMIHFHKLYTQMQLTTPEPAGTNTGWTYSSQSCGRESTEVEVDIEIIQTFFIPVLQWLSGQLQNWLIVLL